MLERSLAELGMRRRPYLETVGLEGITMYRTEFLTISRSGQKRAKCLRMPQLAGCTIIAAIGTIRRTATTITR